MKSNSSIPKNSKTDIGEASYNDPDINKSTKFEIPKIVVQLHDSRSSSLYKQRATVSGDIFLNIIDLSTTYFNAGVTKN